MSSGAHVSDLEVLSVPALSCLLKPVEPSPNLVRAVFPCRVHNRARSDRLEPRAIVCAWSLHLSRLAQPLAITAQRPCELESEPGLPYPTVSGQHRNAAPGQPVLYQPALPVVRGYAVRQLKRLGFAAGFQRELHGVEIDLQGLVSVQQSLVDSGSCAPAHLYSGGFVSGSLPRAP